MYDWIRFTSLILLGLSSSRVCEASRTCSGTVSVALSKKRVCVACGFIVAITSTFQYQCCYQGLRIRFINNFPHGGECPGLSSLAPSPQKSKSPLILLT